MVSKLIYALVFGALVGLLGGILAFGILGPFIENRKVPESRVAIGGPFTLVDSMGKVRTEKDFEGKPMLLYFGFSQCPDICPTGLQTLTVALNNLSTSLDKITVLFVTIDAERDTPQTLATYLRSFHKKILGLSGSPEDIQRILKAYRVYTKKVADPSNPNDYTFDHSSFFYLMDDKGKYVKHFPSSIPIEKLASELAAYLENIP